MPRRSPPKYARHSTGQARCRVDGKVVYLGEFGSAESHARYAALVAKWLQKHGPDADQLTVGGLSLAYMDFARGHYRKNGEPTSEIFAIEDMLRRLNRLSRTVRVADLSPRHVKGFQAALVKDGLARTTVNAYVAKLRRMVKWAVSEELIPATVLLALQTVSGLKRGRTDARETDPVGPIPQERIDAIRPHVSTVVWGLIQFQLLTGARPSEALTLRGCDINTAGDIWEYRPASHKTEHHDKERVVMIGKRAQALLRDFLTTDLQARVFPGYRRDAYRNAIARGCESAFEMPEELRTLSAQIMKLPKPKRAAAKAAMRDQFNAAKEWRRQNCWHPNQLRHNFGTLARRAAGIEAARVTLGHSSVKVSEIYAERDFDAARAVVAQIG